MSTTNATFYIIDKKKRTAKVRLSNMNTILTISRSVGTSESPKGLLKTQVSRYQYSEVLGQGLKIHTWNKLSSDNVLLVLGLCFEISLACSTSSFYVLFSDI